MGAAGQDGLDIVLGSTGFPGDGHPVTDRGAVGAVEELMEETAAAAGGRGTVLGKQPVSGTVFDGDPRGDEPVGRMRLEVVLEEGIPAE